jgi:uncharacterized protein with GYD domain
MSNYLLQVTYTQEGVAAMIDNPMDNAAAIRQVIERLDGKTVGCYLSFGADDVIVIADLPDHITAEAFTLAANASGVVRVKTTPLLATQEAIDAMKKAARAGSFRPVAHKAA